MNSYERLFARMAGKAVDRIPNNCIIMGFGAKYIGASYSQFVTDYRILSEAAIRCREDFHLDILSVISDPMREAEGLGAHVIIPEDGVPYSPEPFITDIIDISRIRVTAPEKSARMNDRLLAVRRLSEYAKKECAVQGWVEGAFAEACDLRDISNMMMDIVIEPEACQALLEICCEQSILFAQAQIEAGADVIGIGDAAASLIGPAMYEEFAFPYEKRLVQAIHAMGAKAKLHICGDINKLLDTAVETGTDIIDCDWMVDFAEANKIFDGKVSASGNLDPVAVILDGTPDSIEKAVRQCIEEGSPHSNRFIISSGCEVPPATNPENLLAVARALGAI